MEEELPASPPDPALHRRGQQHPPGASNTRPASLSGREGGATSSSLDVLGEAAMRCDACNGGEGATVGVCRSCVCSLHSAGPVEPLHELVLLLLLLLLLGGAASSSLGVLGEAAMRRVQRG